MLFIKKATMEAKKNPDQQDYRVSVSLEANKTGLSFVPLLSSQAWTSAFKHEERGIESSFGGNKTSYASSSR